MGFRSCFANNMWKYLSNIYGRLTLSFKERKTSWKVSCDKFSFDASWHRFYTSLEVYWRNEQQSSKRYLLWCFDDSSESTVHHVNTKSPVGVQKSWGQVIYHQPFNEPWMEASVFIMFLHSVIHAFPWIDHLWVFMSQDDIDSNKIISLTRGHRAFIDSFCATRDEKHVTLLHSLRRNLSYSGDIVFKSIISSFRELRTTSSFIQHNRNVISRH